MGGFGREVLGGRPYMRFIHPNNCGTWEALNEGCIALRAVAPSRGEAHLALLVAVTEREAQGRRHGLFILA
jgi:hypothetical protein